jgi:hypothetical protein
MAHERWRPAYSSDTVLPRASVVPSWPRPCMHGRTPNPPACSARCTDCAPAACTCRPPLHPSAAFICALQLPAEAAHVRLGGLQPNITSNPGSLPSSQGGPAAARVHAGAAAHVHRIAVAMSGAFVGPGPVQVGAITRSSGPVVAAADGAPARAPAAGQPHFDRADPAAAHPCRAAAPTGAAHAHCASQPRACSPVGFPPRGWVGGWAGARACQLPHQAPSCLSRRLPASQLSRATMFSAMLFGLKTLGALQGRSRGFPHGSTTSVKASAGPVQVI